MDGLQSKLSVSGMTVYFGIFKEPRGLIRLLQFVFAIFAFATACSGGDSLTLGQGNNNAAVIAAWFYPYNLQNSQIITDLNQTQDTLSTSNSVKPSAEFFVFTGVTSMLISLALGIVYVFLDHRYRTDERVPIIDWVITLIWTIFWLAGSSAWAQGVTDIRTQTSTDYVMGIVTDCSNASPCTVVDSGTYANITVSVIFGFLNFLLWVGSVWFVYKETKFFKSRTAQQQQQQQQQTPQTNFSNIGAPTMTQPAAPQFRPPGIKS